LFCHSERFLFVIPNAFCFCHSERPVFVIPNEVRNLLSACISNTAALAAALFI